MLWPEPAISFAAVLWVGEPSSVDITVLVEVRLCWVPDLESRPTGRQPGLRVGPERGRPDLHRALAGPARQIRLTIAPTHLALEHAWPNLRSGEGELVLGLTNIVGPYQMAAAPSTGHCSMIPG